MPVIKLPTLHAGQVGAYSVIRENRFTAVRCGRRWGKTDLGKTIASDGAAKGQLLGWFAPDYRIQAEAYNEILDLLDPIVKASSKNEGIIRTVTGGRVDFWTLENERAGRSRKYHKVILDEIAFGKDNVFDIWERSIKPTLLDYKGKAIALSNTNGVKAENFLYRVCHQPEHGFAQYHAPSVQNPYLPTEEIERLRATTHPLVFSQEYESNFVDFSGVAFFGRDKLLTNDAPVAPPVMLDTVFAVIDSATKTGTENDGTAVVYCGLNKHLPGPKLFVLDWDLVQIEGALLEAWLPTVFQNLEALGAKYRCRFGTSGVHIEDKASGMILIQQAQRRGWNAHAIDSKLTSVGKDERAISVSGYVYQELVKITPGAYDKVNTFKGVTRNHMLSQVFGFRIGDKDAAKRADDLLDAFVYSVALGLGNSKGF